MSSLSECPGKSETRTLKMFHLFYTRTQFVYLKSSQNGVLETIRGHVKCILIYLICVIFSIVGHNLYVLKSIRWYIKCTPILSNLYPLFYTKTKKLCPNKYKEFLHIIRTVMFSLLAHKAIKKRTLFQLNTTLKQPCFLN